MNIMKKILLLLSFIAVLFFELSAKEIENNPPIKKLEKSIIKNIADTTVEAELIRLSKQWMDAMQNHDSAGLLKLMSPDYYLQGWDTANNRKTYRADWLDNLFNRIRITKFEQSSFRAQVFGDVGIVTSFYTWAGNFATKDFSNNGFIMDVWMRKNNKWQVTSRTAGIFPGGIVMERNK